MQLSVIGLNHNTAPVEIRERMAVQRDMLPQVYADLLTDKRVSEAMIISTCNRVEYYLVTDNSCTQADALYTLAIGLRAGVAQLRKHSYTKCGREAVEHLVMVASGVDSLVLGEPQIFGQVKDAFRNARKEKTIGVYLNRLEQFVLNTTKKVRTDTGISENAVSVSYAAVDLAKKIFGSLDNKKALVIGAGEMCELAAEHLSGSGIQHITVTNRTFSRAEDLARKFGGSAIEFDRFTEIFPKVDIVISSTGSPTSVVSKEMVQNAMRERRQAPMFFIDIAVPRDIDQAVADVENVYVYDIDDLRHVVESNRRERENEAVKAKELIKSAVTRFEKSISSLAADPLIVAMRRKAGSTRREELARCCRKYGINDQETRDRLSYIMLAMENKLLHTPTINLKAYIADGRKYTLAEAVALLFDTNRE